MYIFFLIIRFLILFYNSYYLFIIYMTYNYNTVIQSINLYNSLKKRNISGIERKNIMIDTFTFSMSTFYNWLFLYKNLSKNDFKNHFINTCKRKGKITKEIIDFILNVIKENIFIRCRGIKNLIKEKFNTYVSETSIRTILYKNNITFKKVYKQINPYSESELKEKKKKLKNKIKRHGIKNITSVDEMSIHLNEQPSKSWSEKGKQNINETKNKCILGKRYSLCMSVDVDKNINYIIKEKSIKSDDFNNFIKTIIKKNKKPILMDNAKIHHSKLFNNTVKKNKINVIYNIPYFSKYNPIEYIFSLRSKEIENNNCNSKNEIIKVIENFKKNIKKETIENIFIKTNKMLN